MRINKIKTGGNYMKFKRKLSAILAVLMLLSNMPYGASAVETKSEVNNVNATVSETQDTPEGETSDTPSIEKNNTELSADGVTDYGLCEHVQDGVILHAFCWSFNTIKANMADIAAAGYTAVQTSPPNACNAKCPTLALMGLNNGQEVTDGSLGAWWWHYQPIDWTIGNYQLGTKQDYVDMCSEANKYGIKIIADVLPNHTTPDLDLVSDDFINAVGGKRENGTITGMYHSNGFTSITNYDDREQSILNASGELPDINTENPDFQVYFVKYLNELVEAGCDGLRLDTAKHIGVFSDPEDSANVEKGYKNIFWDVATGQQPVTNSHGETVQFNKPDDFFIYGEILQGNNIPYYEYSKYMSMVASSYGYTIRNAVRANDFSVSRVNVSKWNHSLSPDKLVSWVESHDTYCNKHESSDWSNEEVRLAWAAIAARKETTPLFFSRPHGSFENGKGVWGDNTIGIAGNDEFKCDVVKAVNNFRNAMVGQDETLRNPNSNSKLLQIDRGSLGTCIINLNSSAITLTNQATTLANGTYRDYVSGVNVTVSNGCINSCTIAGRSIAVIYSTAKISASDNNAVFSTDGYDVKVKVSGIKEGTTPTYVVTVYGETIQDGTFTNGDTIDVGNGVDVTETSKEIVLTLTATDTNNSTVTKSFTYVKRDPQDINYIYFDNTTYKWSTPSAYIYYSYSIDDNEYVEENHAWPGETMTLVPGTNYYKYEVPYNLKNGVVIFYSGNNVNNTKVYRYPSEGAGGISVNGKTMMLTEGNTWEEFDPNSIYYTEPELEEPEGNRYVYYFNSLGRTDDIYAMLLNSTNNETNNSNGVKMTWSDDLHCYYCAYNSSKSYDKVVFSDGKSSPSTKTNELTLREGKIFVPTSKSGSIESGQWISPADIYEHTIYFRNTAKWTNNMYAYLFEGDRKSADYPGQTMKSLGNDLYAYTYYYPRLGGSSNTDYEKVQFNNKTDGINGSRTLSMTTEHTEAPDKIVVYDNAANGDTSYPGNSTEEILSTTKEIAVKVHYFNTKLASDGSVFSTDTDTEIQVTSNKAENAVAAAISEVDGKNAYNELVGYTTQFNYVKELAKSYGANISPDKFVNQSDYFSGIGKDYPTDNTSQKWVTFKNGETEVSFDQIKPDMSNLTNIDVYLWAKAKTYKVDFIYPTSANAELTTFKNQTLSFVNGNTVQMHSQKRYYNESIGLDGTSIITDMVTLRGKEFDGWYCLNISNTTVKSYYKVSSFRNYNCRVTANLTLYAVFRDSGTEVSPGATTTTSGVDDYIADAQGTVKHRFNTILNIYNCNRSDTDITNVGVVYVRYGSSVTDYNIDAVKTALNEGENSIISGNKQLNEKLLTNLKYDYYTYPISSDGYKLTNMNRVQFALNKTDSDVKTDGEYSNVLAFTTFQRDGKWYLSDNCVLYKNGEATQMFATN